MIDRSSYSHETTLPKWKFFILGGIIFFIILIYTGYLFNLQIINTLIYERKATEVARRSEIIFAQRGKIFDRDYDNPLAINIDSFAITITPGKIDQDQIPDLLNRLSEVLNINNESLHEMIPPRMYNYYQPIEIKNGAEFSDIVYLAEHSNEFPGVEWSGKTLRYYPSPGSISHLLGYVGNITSEELQILFNKGYSTYSELGKSGLERQYDLILRGKDGRRFRTVDARGLELSKDEIEPPINGMDIVLTIDNDIQILAEKALGRRKGSVVVLKPYSGEILAMVSYPNFNPNRFDEEGNQGFKELSLNKDFPFLNRAIQSSYAPASTFKIIMSLALLEEQAFDPERRINCTGTMQVGNREFKCHKRWGHGYLNLEEALAESCNIYFGTVGIEYLGIDVISEYASILGLGSETEIDLPDEAVGIVPTPSWKKQIYNTPWTRGDTLNVSIGQGFLNVTPLQEANVLAAIVNDGIIYKPHLVKEIRDPLTGKIIQNFDREILHETYISSETFQAVRESMRSVVTDGTAQVVMRNNVVDVAGKTGTGEIGPDEQWHSWFVAYGPYDAPPEDVVIVVVFVEATETWDWWAPKAADMIFQGIFANMTYEEVVDNFRRRGVWYINDATISE